MKQRFASKFLSRHHLSTVNRETLWPLDRVRSEFIEYFSSKHSHVKVPSSPCVPYNDPTLLFTNAGMNQFKPIFVGAVDPKSPHANLRRAVNSQKCIRAGGKHNDLDDVGKDTYHHTFFEMLGTWSFGDYFKENAIDWAFDILTTKYNLDPQRLYASYFAGDKELGIPEDEEAKNYWLKHLPPSRVLPFDKKANFWEMGDVGPCGPCTEIHYDRIGNRDASKFVNADNPDVIEIWNLVFIQYNRESDGKLKLLPSKHVDTGMGLERLTSILQNRLSNYDIDAFSSMLKEIQSVANCAPYSGKIGDDDALQNYRDTAYRIVCDHIRTLSFAIADGARPSNEGRGYVLRRILRRAVRYGVQNLGAQSGFLHQLIPKFCLEYGVAYPELISNSAEIISILKKEEDAFSLQLSKVIEEFSRLIKQKKINKDSVVSGAEAFFFHDTLGFPIDLLEIMATENKLSVNMEEYREYLLKQKFQSRAATEIKKAIGSARLELNGEQIADLRNAGVSRTFDDDKYDANTKVIEDSAVLAVLCNGSVQQAIDFEDSDFNNPIGLVFNKTNFYSESGGQIFDSGRIILCNNDVNGKGILLDVVDVQAFGGYVVHSCVLSDESPRPITLSCGPKTLVTLIRDDMKRNKVACNHSVTHMLNYVLRQIFGESINQKGSLVTADRLRFDFSHDQAISLEQIEKVEEGVNNIISSNIPIFDEIMPLHSASKIPGVRAVFGEVYPNPVRVVSIGKPALLNDNNFTSIEFCGGTHAKNTNDAIRFVVVEETSIGRGVRRIVGITGTAAINICKSSEVFSGEVQAFIDDEVVGKNSSDHSIEMLKEYRMKLDNQLLSCATKLRVRSLLDNAHKFLFSRKSSELNSLAEQLFEKISNEILCKQDSINSPIVGIIEMTVQVDPKIIKRFVDMMKKNGRDCTFVCFIPENTKLNVVAFVSDEMQNVGLKANDWVNYIVSSYGGKGGGKPSQAQGSCCSDFTVEVCTAAADYCDKFCTQTKVNIKL